MGADIHVWLERKLPNGKWVMHDRCGKICREAYGLEPDNGSYSSPHEYHRVRSRNYRFFADLAGVRGLGPDPRGVPSDVSDYVQHEIDEWGGDGHSHSWMLAREFMPIFAEHHLDPKHAVSVVGGERNWRWVFEHVFATYIEDADEPAESAFDRFRFVFFFDN